MSSVELEVANRLAGQDLDKIPKLSTEIRRMLRHIRCLNLVPGTNFRHPFLSVEDFEGRLEKWMRDAEILESTEE